MQVKSDFDLVLHRLRSLFGYVPSVE
jgi:hypothetical protein